MMCKLCQEMSGMMFLIRRHFSNERDSFVEHDRLLVLYPEY